LVRVPLEGVETLRAGAKVSIVTDRVSVCVKPAAFVATTVNVCAPLAKLTERMKDPSAPTETDAPSIVTLAPGSVVPDTVTEGLLVRVPSVGLVTARFGWPSPTMY